MDKLKFTGLKDVLKKFDEHGWKGIFIKGDWKIANGGYDLWFELYYKNQPVAQCIAGELSSHFGIPLMEKAKLYHKILETYDHLSLARDAYFSEAKIEEAIEWGWEEEEAKRGWSYRENPDLPGILAIERIDEMGVFESDLEAAQFAKACGEPLFALPKSSYPLNAYYFMDTKENREAVLQYAKKHGIQVSFDKKQKELTGVTIEDNSCMDFRDDIAAVGKEILDRELTKEEVEEMQSDMESKYVFYSEEYRECDYHELFNEDFCELLKEIIEEKGIQNGKKAGIDVLITEAKETQALQGKDVKKENDREPER